MFYLFYCLVHIIYQVLYFCYLVHIIYHVFSFSYLVHIIYQVYIYFCYLVHIIYHVLSGANSRFLGLVSVWAARSFDQMALRPSVIKRIRQIDVKYITHITSFGVTAWTRVTAWTCMCELPRCTVHWTRISIHWILDFKQLLLLLLLLLSII